MNCKNGMIAFGNVAHFAHIVNLCRVIILEIGRVVDVSELIGIGKSQLNLQFMMKFYLFHFPKIFLSVDNAVGERTSVRCPFSVAIFAFFPDIYKYFPLDLNDFFEYMGTLYKTTVGAFRSLCLWCMRSFENETVLCAFAFLIVC